VKYNEQTGDVKAKAFRLRSDVPVDLRQVEDKTYELSTSGFTFRVKVDVFNFDPMMVSADLSLLKGTTGAYLYVERQISKIPDVLDLMVDDKMASAFCAFMDDIQ